MLPGAVTRRDEPGREGARRRRRAGSRRGSVRGRASDSPFADHDAVAACLVRRAAHRTRCGGSRSPSRRGSRRPLRGRAPERRASRRTARRPARRPTASVSTPSWLTAPAHGLSRGKRALSRMTIRSGRMPSDRTRCSAVLEPAGPPPTIATSWSKRRRHGPSVGDDTVELLGEITDELVELGLAACRRGDREVAAALREHAARGLREPRRCP